MRVFSLFIFMVVASFFAESLLVSATLVRGRAFKIQSIPFLRNRCANLGIGSSPTGRNTSAGHAVPSSIGSLRVQNRTGLTRSMSSSSNDEKRDVVRRMPITSESARSTIPDIVIRAAPNSDEPIEFKPWLLDWAVVVEKTGDIYFELGDGCSERMYQQALLHALYRMHIPVLIERPVYATKDGHTVLKGRVDLEIAGRFILELKVTTANSTNIRKDKKQLQRYISAYKDNNVRLQRAALVYFGNGEVRIVEVPV